MSSEEKGKIFRYELNMKCKVFYFMILMYALNLMANNWFNFIVSIACVVFIFAGIYHKMYLYKTIFDEEAYKERLNARRKK